MPKKKEYIKFKISDLNAKESIFPFTIYLENLQNNKYTVFLHSNSPLTGELKIEAEQAQVKGASLAISSKQKKTFLEHSGLKENDLIDLKKLKASKEELVRQQRVEEHKKARENLEVDYRELSFEAIDNEDFSKLIQFVREDVLIFEITKSNTISLAIELTEKILKEDNPNNRVVVLSYILAQILKINSQEEVADLLCAAYLHHIGMTQIDLFYSRTPFLDFDEKTQKKYQRHPGLSHHLIKKSRLEINESAIKIILDHHERADGRGFPRGKKVAALSPLSLILGLCSHMVDFAEGLVTGKKMPLKKVINSIANKSLMPGLELEFGDKVLGGLTSFISTQKTNKTT